MNTIDTLNNRVSIRDYTDEAISDETVLTILNAARRSATSSNVQAYSFVVVRAPDVKKQLAHLAGEQEHIETCPVFVAVCADISRMKQACDLHGQPLATNMELTMVAIVDAAIAGQSAALAAESLGYGTVMIGGMRNHPREVGALLGLPEGVFCLYGLCIGSPARFPTQKPRLPQEAIIHFEQYKPVSEETLRAHDAELAAHYRSDGRRSPDAAWTGVVARKFTVYQRDHMREFLEERGYSVD